MHMLPILMESFMPVSQAHDMAHYLVGCSRIECSRILARWDEPAIWAWYKRVVDMDPFLLYCTDSIFNRESVTTACNSGYRSSLPYRLQSPFSRDGACELQHTDLCTGSFPHKMNLPIMLLFLMIVLQPTPLSPGQRIR